MLYKYLEVFKLFIKLYTDSLTILVFHDFENFILKISVKENP